MSSPLASAARLGIRRHMPRRDFLKASMGAASAAVLGGLWTRSAVALPREQDLRIVNIERTTVKLDFRPAPNRAMSRELPHWKYSEVFEVRLQSGDVGLGETLLYYTWGATDDADVARAEGRNAAALMWDDSLGAGLQMALFDAVARAAQVPVHRLLGSQVHENTPLSWWNIDTSAADMASECAEAHRQGYTAYKTKGRPWFDLWRQMDLATAAVPETFKIDMDFNDTLLDAKRALPIIKDMDAYPQFAICESPIDQANIKDNQIIRRAMKAGLAMHYGTPDPIVALKEEICDGFVVGGGASKVMAAGRVAAMANKPFWLQLVGTGITAAFSLHFGAVLSHATWPAVNCHQLFTTDMLAKPIVVRDGMAEVPTTPGLGYQLDRAALERYRVEKPRRRPDPPRLIETTWPNGQKVFYAPTGEVNFMLNPARRGETPFFRRGADTRLVPNDGSAQWRKRFEAAKNGPVFE